MVSQQEDSTTGAKAQNEEWFANDIEPNCQPGQTVTIRIQFNVAVANVIEWTPDSGATYFALGPAVTADVDTVFELDLDGADQFNIRDATIGGNTVNYARITIVA